MGIVEKVSTTFNVYLACKAAKSWRGNPREKPGTLKAGLFSEADALLCSSVLVFRTRNQWKIFRRFFLVCSSCSKIFRQCSISCCSIFQIFQRRWPFGSYASVVSTIMHLPFSGFVLALFTKASCLFLLLVTCHYLKHLCSKICDNTDEPTWDFQASCRQFDTPKVLFYGLWRVWIPDRLYRLLPCHATMTAQQLHRLPSRFEMMWELRCLRCLGGFYRPNKSEGRRTIVLWLQNESTWYHMLPL